MRASLLRRLLAIGGGVLLSLGQQAQAQQTTAPKVATEQAIDQLTAVAPLRYAEDALAPAISARTVALHYGKHLQGYSRNLKALLQAQPTQAKDLIELVRQAEGSTFDNAGQLLNHTLYFNQFKPYQQGQIDEPQGALREALLRHFGSFSAFQAAFEKAGASIFGSGWLWLSTDREGRLYIEKHQDAGSPVPSGRIPLIAVDVWEHAYYLDYENRRAEHLKELWHIYDWQRIAERYEARAQMTLR